MVLKLKDVFTPGGQPDVTYVDREHLHLEDSVRKVLSQGYTLNVITGPTKSGKTVLCRRVLDGGYKYVPIEGGQIRTETDFWNGLAHHLNIAHSANKSSSDTKSDQTSGELSGGIAGIVAGKGSHTKTDSLQKTSAASYNNNLMLSSLKRLQDEDITLLIDDFHYIPSDVQRIIIQSLKSAIFNGLNVILLAVPHRAFDPITVEDEFQGRFRHIEIPPWTLEDLALIPKRGFDALNVKTTEELRDRVCSESFSNPLLSQEICSELCANAGVFMRQDVPKEITIDDLQKTFESVASSKGFPKFRKLKEGPQSRKDRQLRSLRNGTSADIYEALMMAFGRLGPKPRTQYDELRATMRDLIDEGQVPQKHEITSALTHMTKIAREQITGEPPLEFVKSEDAVVITDPFLLFYMKWQKQKIAPGSTL